MNIHNKYTVKSVAIMGLGTFGQQIAKTLFQQGVDILALDRDQAKVDRVAPWVSKALCADVHNLEVLKSHGILDFEFVIIALRRFFDATVLLTNALAKAGVKNIIVQVDSESEAEVVQIIGATSVVLPQRDMAVQIAHKLLSPSLTDFLPIGANYSIIEEPVPACLSEQSLIQLELRKKYGVTALAIKNPLKDSIEVNPDPNNPLEKGAGLLLLGENKNLDRLMNDFAEIRRDSPNLQK